MAKFKLYYYSNDRIEFDDAKTEEVEAGRFADSKTGDWIEFFQGEGSATRTVLRVKASNVWKVERVK